MICSFRLHSSHAALKHSPVWSILIGAFTSCSRHKLDQSNHNHHQEMMNKIELGVISVVSVVVFLTALIGSAVLIWSANSQVPKISLRA